MHQCSIGFVLWSVRSWIKTGKAWLVDLLMEDYDVSLSQRVGVHDYYSKDHIITCDRCGSSILLYVKSFGDRLLLMRTHEDLSSDMELPVVCILWFCCDIFLRNVMEYMKLIILPAFLEGAVFLKRRKMPKGILSNCNLYVTRLMQMTTYNVFTMKKNGKHVLFSKHYKPCKLSSME